MDESSETPGPKPEILQMTLGSLFRELPTKGPNLQQQLTEVRDKLVKNNQMLDVLLSSANTTGSLKNAIRNAFDDASMVGISEDDFPWESLGLREPIHPQGIFSNDPKTRMKIERSIYVFKRGELDAYMDTQKVEPSRELDYLVTDSQKSIRAMREQFQTLYGEPIESTPIN